MNKLYLIIIISLLIGCTNNQSDRDSLNNNTTQIQKERLNMYNFLAPLRAKNETTIRGQRLFLIWKAYPTDIIDVEILSNEPNAKILKLKNVDTKQIEIVTYDLLIDAYIIKANGS